MMPEPACLGKGYLITKKGYGFLAITLNIINISLTLPKHAPRAFANIGWRMELRLSYSVCCRVPIHSLPL